MSAKTQSDGTRVVPAELFAVFYQMNLQPAVWRPLYSECGHIRAFTIRASAEDEMEAAKELMGSTPLQVFPLAVKQEETKA